MIRIDRPRQPVGRPCRFQQKRRQGRCPGDAIGQRIHLRNIVLDLGETCLRDVPLVDQGGIAGGRADLQLRVHRGDRAVVILRMLHRHVADRLKLRVLLADLGLQPLQFTAQFSDALADIGAGGRPLRHARWNEVGPAQRGRRRRRQGRLPGRFGLRRGYVRLRTFVAGRVLADQRRPQGVGCHGARAKQSTRQDKRCTEFRSLCSGSYTGHVRPYPQYFNFTGSDNELSQIIGK